MADTIKCEVCASPAVTKTYVCTRCGGDVHACEEHEDEVHAGYAPVCKRCEDTAKRSIKAPPIV